MVRHPHHDNIKSVGLGQWVLILYYLSRTVHYPHPVQSLVTQMSLLKNPKEEEKIM